MNKVLEFITNFGQKYLEIQSKRDLVFKPTLEYVLKSRFIKISASKSMYITILTIFDFLKLRVTYFR